ncbi:ABC transporter ATP-binding protein [Blautia faecicola]|uniref:ABC transporter ATP-binding protein n=1 Tax=Blautia faecicola TaxID=2509240 RepID=A0A4Q1RHQ7_9FIRM|nr:ABC transporter ATP-binding protein [Blautia faecicola]
MKTQMKEILSIIWKYSRLWGCMKLLNSVLTAIIVPVNTVLLQRIVNDILILLQENHFHFILNTHLVIFIAGVFSEVLLTGLDRYVEIRFDMQITDRLEKEIVRKYRKLDYSCYEDPQTYDSISRISQNPGEKIRMIFWKLCEMVRIIILLIGYLLIFQQASPLLVGIFLLFLPPILYENYKAGCLWYDLYSRQTADERKIAYYERLLTGKTSLAELKIYQATDYIEKLWKKQSSKLRKEKEETLIRVEKTLLRKSTFAALWYLCSGGFLLYGVITGRISVSMFLVLFQTILNIVDTVNGLLETFGNFSREIQEMSYLHSFFALKNIPERKGCIDRPVRRIRFEHVCFSYPNAGTETLHDISFELDLSKSTAIVGENGSGKTTIIKLLCGLYQPTSGRILFDEYDIRNLNNGEIGKAIKVVFQDFFQYELTIRENIGFGNLARISHDLELQEVLDAVHLEELKKLGLDTSLGKLEHEGIDLSRGQWQRLAVGRIFLNDTGYAVLDEPTASVDPVSEYNMYQLFYLLLRSRGSLMISHRLASAKMADHILVLKNGTIAEQGNHTELMKNQELYHELFCRQAEWYQ